MTDFIHEHPDEHPAPPAEQKPVSEHERQKKVYTYIAILFTMAFILILWSFLSTNRSNQQVISELKDSSSYLQSTLSENETLEDRVGELEENVMLLEAELSEARQKLEENAEAAAAIYDMAVESSAEVSCAMDWLREIQSAYETGSYRSARAMLREFNETGLSGRLSAEPLHTFGGNDAASPAETYQKICNALFPDGVIQ